MCLRRTRKPSSSSWPMIWVKPTMSVNMIARTFRIKRSSISVSLLEESGYIACFFARFSRAGPRYYQSYLAGKPFNCAAKESVA